jgi:putative transposase
MFPAGIGDVEVSVPRVRDRQGEIRFTSSLLSRYLRRTKSIKELLPWRYLKGLSMGDFQELISPNTAITAHAP